MEKDSTIWSLVKKFISSAKGKVTPRLNLIKIRSSQRAIPIYSFKLIAVVLNSGYLSQRNSNSAVKRAALAREPTVPKHERPMKPMYIRNSYPAVSACSIVRFWDLWAKFTRGVIMNSSFNSSSISASSTLLDSGLIKLLSGRTLRLIAVVFPLLQPYAIPAWSSYFQVEFHAL